MASEQGVCYWDHPNDYGLLSPNNARVSENINGLDVTLYDHQCIAVCAMLDLEKRRKTVIETDLLHEVYTSAGILAEPFGAGKTIECLALIKLCQQPEFKPISVYNKTINVRYYGYKLITSGKLVRPNLIIVGASVFNQWLDMINKITDFSVLSVFNNKTLREFSKIINDNTIDNYDIVLVKSGDSSTSMIQHPAILKLGANAAIPSCVALMTHNYIWSRIIIDDYDTIGLKNDRGASIGRFTWYISATQKRLNRNIADSDAYSVVSKSHLHRVINDVNLNEYFKIANKMEYVNECIKIYKPRFWAHYIKHDMSNIINYITNNTELTDVQREMINSDAIGTLAEMMGLKTDNIMGIFEKLLSDKFDKYKKTTLYHKNILRAIEYQKGDHKRATTDNKNSKQSTASDKHDSLQNNGSAKTKRAMPQFMMDPYSMLQKNTKSEIKKCIKEGKIDNLPYIPNMVEYLEALAEKVTQEIAEQDKGLQRLRENFRNDECSICLLEFENNVFVLKCCGYSICESCVYKGTQMHTSTTKIDGSCPNCKSKIKFTDLIALDPNIDIKEITDKDSFTNQLIENTNNGNTSDNTDKCDKHVIVYDKLHPKVKVVYDIINDKLPQKDTPIVKKLDMSNTKYIDQLRKMTDTTKSFEIDGQLKNIIASDILLERPINEKKKVIIFANYCETLTIVEQQLSGMTMTLQGTARQMYNQIQEYKSNDIPLLLINSQKHCAGINLQFASDLVFFHKIVNPALEAQVGGRIQRPGRKYSANIHYVLYNNERL